MKAEFSFHDGQLQESNFINMFNLLDKQVFQKAVRILYKRLCTTEHMG